MFKKTALFLREGFPEAEDCSSAINEIWLCSSAGSPISQLDLILFAQTVFVQTVFFETVFFLQTVFLVSVKAHQYPSWI